jgi:hypothetical protein
VRQYDKARVPIGLNNANITDASTESAYLIDMYLTKIHIYMGSIRQSLQAQPKNIKKLSKHQINQSK